MLQSGLNLERRKVPANVQFHIRAGTIVLLFFLARLPFCIYLMTMSEGKNSRIVVFYSNPDDTRRLRLDKEHRAVDEMLTRGGHSAEAVLRKHATTVDDMLRTLKGHPFEVVQFSGHGDKEGIFIEAGTSGGRQLLAADRLKSLIASCGRRPRAIVLMACYSAEILPELLELSQFVVTVIGPVEDAAAIEFGVTFMDEYLRNPSVETAFSTAQKTVYAKGLTIAPLLSRRFKDDSKAVYTVFPGTFGDSILVDISEVEDDINRIGLARDTFLRLLTQKIRVHHWLFKIAKEEAIIPMGTYFGVFSWNTPGELVTCRRLLRVIETAPVDAITAWTSMLIAYNDLFVQRYRCVSGPANPSGYHKMLERAVKAYHSCYRAYLGESENAKIFQRISPAQFGVTRGIFDGQFERLDESLADEDHVTAVTCLESILTSFHDLVSAVGKSIVE
jgi:hypothetical protein